MSKHKGGRKKLNKKKKGEVNRNAQYFGKLVSGMVNVSSGHWHPISSAGLDNKPKMAAESISERCQENVPINLASRQNRGRYKGNRNYHA